MMDIVNDIYTLLFVLSTLVIIRNLFFLIRSLRMEEKFKIERSSLVILGLSISYFITSIINVLK
jgi:hypothetical protein